MTAVANDRNAYLLVVGKVSLLTGLVRVHSDLVTCTHCTKLVSAACVFEGQTGSQGVHIEEGILPVLNVGDWVPVERLVTGVAHSWQIHPSALLFDLDPLEPKLLVNHLFWGLLTRHRGTRQRLVDP